MRLVIAGVHSGVGKTTLTAGLIAALSRGAASAGRLSVQPFKVGPDYIDPTYHTLAAGRPCRNLDAWMVPPDRLPGLFASAARGADLALVEGVMGLFDGLSYESDVAGTAQVARLLRAPVVLVLDAARMGRSAAAIVLGYQRFDSALDLAGVIINRVGSQAHGRGVAAAIRQATRLPVLGWLPRDDVLHVPERHLGLVPTAEPGRWEQFIAAAAAQVAACLDLDGLLAIARSAPDLLDIEDPLADLHHGLLAAPQAFAQPGLPGPLIAVAQDEAFNFTYADNLDLLRAAGARLAFFSPLSDPTLPPGAAGIILGGGFPELYAPRLSANHAMRASLQAAHAAGLPIYAECGGLMALTESIIDLDGQEHPMFGLLPGRSRMTGQLTLGYRLARAAGDSWLMRMGETVRGHEFHYSAWEGRPAGLPPAFTLQSREGAGEPSPEGACLGSLWASYVHLHFWGRPELAARFVGACPLGVADAAS